VSGKVVGWAFEAEGLTVNQKFVLVKLADNSDAAGLCWPRQVEIAARTGLSERTVRNCLVDLEEKGFLAREARMKLTGRGRSSDLYRLAVPTDQPANGDSDAGRPTGKSRTTNRQIQHDQPATALPVPYIEEPSVEPSGNPQAVRKLTASARIDGKAVNAKSWKLTERVLASFNEQAGTKLRLITSSGKPSEAAKRIYMRIRTYPDLGFDDHADIIRRTLSSKWWGDDSPTIGVVYGPKVFEDNITRSPSRNDRNARDAEQRALDSKRLEAIKRLTGRG
jgi:predicted transcriptional regulator